MYNNSFGMLLVSNRRKSLLHITGILTARYYIDDVMLSHHLEYLQGIPRSNFSSKQHSTIHRLAHPESIGSVQVLPWSTRYLNISPIEHVGIGSMIGHQLSNFPSDNEDEQFSHINNTPSWYHRTHFRHPLFYVTTRSRMQYPKGTATSYWRRYI